VLEPVNVWKWPMLSKKHPAGTQQSNHQSRLFEIEFALSTLILIQ